MSDKRLTDPAYRPISCALHSEYELAILQRQKLRLAWGKGNTIRTQVVLPVDLKTVNKEEYLVCQTDTGERLELRLDQVRKMGHV